MTNALVFSYTASSVIRKMDNVTVNKATLEKRVSVKTTGNPVLSNVRY